MAVRFRKNRARIQRLGSVGDSVTEALLDTGGASMIRNKQPRWFETVRFRASVLLIALTFLPGVGAWAQRLQGTIEAVAYPNIVVYNGKIVTMDDTSLSNSL